MLIFLLLLVLKHSWMDSKQVVRETWPVFLTRLQRLNRRARNKPVIFGGLVMAAGTLTRTVTRLNLKVTNV